MSQSILPSDFVSSLSKEQNESEILDMNKNIRIIKNQFNNDLDHQVSIGNSSDERFRKLIE